MDLPPITHYYGIAAILDVRGRHPQPLLVSEIVYLLPHSKDCMILSSFVRVQYQHVTDKWTDRLTNYFAMAITALCLALHRFHRLTWRASTCSLLLIYRPGEDKRLSWLGWLTSSAVYPHKWSPFSWRSSMWQGKFAGQDRRSCHCARLPSKLFQACEQCSCAVNNQSL